MSFSKYPEYKATGLEWPTEAPAHWKQKRLKFVVQLNPSRSEVSDRDRSEEVSFLPMEAVGDDGSLSLEQTRPIAAVETGYTYFRDGDVTIAKITPCFENGKGAVMSGLRGGIGFGTTELIVARPRPGEVVPEYLHSVFTSASFRGFGEASMYGAGGQKRVSDDFVRNFRPPMPPLPEQAQIQNFLAGETAKIDALVAEQERLIELLEEKRQAVISHAVTKGLDPTLPMKNSGIAWIGDFPSHWELHRVKNVARLESGHTPSKQVAEYWENCTLPWVSLNDSKQLASSDYITETAVQISELGLANSSARMLPAGAVVFTRDATIGLAAIITRSMAVSQHLIAWCPGRKIEGLYLLRVFNAMKAFLDSTTFGATIKTIGMADVKKLVTPVPPLGEQREIAAYIDAKKAEFAEQIDAAQSVVTLLHERRSALISAAVTGQIDVRQLEVA